LVLPIAVNNAAERVEVPNAEGQPLVALTLTDKSNLTYADMQSTGQETGWPIVRTVLAGVQDPQGDKQAQIVETDTGFVL
jgi:hypothetical protein